MRFRAAHKLSSYLLVASAVFTLGVSGGARLPSLALLVLAVAGSWFAEPDGRVGRAITKLGGVLTAVALAVFGWALFAVVRSFPEPDLSPLLDLIFFLLAYKLVQRRTNRDYLQVYILSFLLVLAGSWLAQSALYGIGFAAFVVFSTWTLVLFHLRREIEDNYLVKHSTGAGTEKVTVTRVLDSRRVVGRPFFVATGGAALAVLLGAALVFAAAPRIGLGFITGAARRRTNIVGFSDDVRLGMHGVLSADNDTVVMRVTMPHIAALGSTEERDDAIAGLYWRGTIYDTYRGGRWLRSASSDGRGRRAALDYTADGRALVFVQPASAPDLARRKRLLLERALRQDIQIVVALPTPVAFALDRPIAFEAPKLPPGAMHRLDIDVRHSEEAMLHARRTFHGDDSGRSGELSGAQYTAYSVDSISSPILGLGRPLEELPKEYLAPYLDVPASIGPKVAALAQEITRGKDQPAAKAQAIIDWLRKTHGYTVELKRNEAIPDPLEDFIFHQQAGHCEYFASALVVLLRLSGVPARYVNGFLGGEWNDIGQHITVRDNRAHSWAEVYMGTYGWIRMDATPPALQVTRMSRVRAMLDVVEAFWARWVIEYDLARQVELARKVGNVLGTGNKRPRGGMAPWMPSAKTLLAIVLSTLAAAWLWRRLKKRGGARPGQAGTRAAAPAYRHYERALKALAAAGFTRAAEETPREYLARLSREGGFLDGTLRAMTLVTRHYERARWGAQTPDAAGLAAIERAVAEVEEGAKARKHERARAA